MKEFDNDKKRIAAKRFMDITLAYNMLFLLSVVLYYIDAFEANTYVYLFFWLLNIVLVYISYKKDMEYKIYGKRNIFVYAPNLLIALAVILLK